ncbi:hypothetical protein D3C73_796990 [compost metagenome]
MVMNKLWTYIFIGIMFTGLIIGWVHQVKADSVIDADRLVNVTQPLLQADAVLTYKYTGIYKACVKQADLLTVGAGLSKELGLPQARELQDTNALIYSTVLKVSKEDSISLKLMWLESSSNCYMVLKRVTTDFPGADTDVSWQKEIGSTLDKLGSSGEWGVMLRGVASDAKSEPAKLMDTLVDKLKGQVLDTYNDQGTLSYSLFSEDFHTGIHSRDQLMNVQVAIHKDSENGRLRVTVGTPIITEEY